jgi:hypothetical protein
MLLSRFYVPVILFIKIPSSLSESGIFYLFFFGLGEEIVEMFKFGTVAEMERLGVKENVPEEVYFEALNTASMLGEIFGEDRDVDFDDGGFVVVAKNKEDLKEFSQKCVELDSDLLEYVQLIQSETESYLNVFYLCNEYESGITLLVPVSIAPERFLQEKFLEVPEVREVLEVREA